MQLFLVSLILVATLSLLYGMGELISSSRKKFGWLLSAAFISIFIMSLHAYSYPLISVSSDATSLDSCFYHTIHHIGLDRNSPHFQYAFRKINPSISKFVDALSKAHSNLGSL